MKATHGGAGRGQGRHPLDATEPTVTYTIKMPASLREKAQAMGAARVRALIESAPEPERKHEYIANYWRTFDDTPAPLALEATTDAQARAELRRLAVQGELNQTGATVELADGREYTCSNLNGKADCQYL